MQPNDLIAPGTVWLVGAGPGDPDLLTRKAERLIAAAEIIFHDALVGPAILDLAASGVELVSVGKRSGRHSKDQGSINDLLLAAARAGKRVVRLKGGDPSIFGRSTEELDHLTAAGVSVRICPGITAASAAAASGLASLTLRGLARRLIFVTAHARAGEAIELDWDALAAPDTTLAVYMGRAAAPEIVRKLIAAGRAPDTPVMIAVNVSLPAERLIRGKLSALPFLTAAISDDDPTLLLIGDATRATAVQATGTISRQDAPAGSEIAARNRPFTADRTA
ncbi:MAG: uroporphyrinogen-III C-methyltransferase [Rhizorhabdus sp.]